MGPWSTVFTKSALAHLSAASLPERRFFFPIERLRESFCWRGWAAAGLLSEIPNGNL
jgi:hypothetical protein